ncbi:nitroreductase family protein [Gymnodinialimonas ulvae]|uniref:nitroreductase family protein n=1 Tax=Gymnodinialimonas ulvae TaxID=3126504 RepID=UPI0030B3ED61
MPPMDNTISPLAPKPDVLDFLLKRRSRPPRSLGTDTPDDATLRRILTAALRVPDHGKLEPWRLIVLRRPAIERLISLTRTRGAERGLGTERIERDINSYTDAHLIVAVVSSPKPSEKVPEPEQQASAAGVCLSLLNATLASGWGAVWLTGWRATDRPYLSQGLELYPHETVAGYLHIGNEIRTPPERPRPDVDALTTWVET